MFLSHYGFLGTGKFQVGMQLSASGKTDLTCDSPSCVVAETRHLFSRCLHGGNFAVTLSLHSKRQINYVFKEQTGHCPSCCVADWIILQFEHQVTGRHLTLVKYFEKSDQSCHIVLLTILAKARCQRGSSSVVEDDTKELLITLCGEPYKVGGPAS